MSGAADGAARLSNGAIVVFGPRALEALAELRSQGVVEDNLVVCSAPAAGLALPDTLMLWAILLFDHPMLGVRGRAPQELEGWRDKLLAGLVFAEPSEPRPKIKMTVESATWNVLLAIEWLPPQDGSWNGVRSSQVKRAALAIEAAYAAAS